MRFPFEKVGALRFLLHGFNEDNLINYDAVKNVKSLAFANEF